MAGERGPMPLPGGGRTRLNSSFRDRDGHVFLEQGRIRRQINSAYLPIYRRLVATGFLAQLWRDGSLIAHREIGADGDSLIIEPEQLAVITYPYEWSFGQLREAALLTLRLQKQAVAAGFSLKDASAYNIQFVGGRAQLIDTLSFEPFVAGQPWVAYRQFCQHFLAPLALMARRDPRLGLLARNHLDGVPLDLASRLLPRRTWLRLGLLFHLHLHARAQSRFRNRDRQVTPRPVSRAGLLGIIEHLESTVRGLRWEPRGTEWSDYYDHTNYEHAAAAKKESVVRRWIEQSQPALVWDLGANDGRFSRLAAATGALTVAWDIDPAAVEQCHRYVVRSGEVRLVPAVLDLTNPSPGLGWNLRERASLFDRHPPDLVLALALLHHLAIGNNVPLADCADFFQRLAPIVVLEWIPKSDSKVQALLRNRTDIFSDYTEDSFRAAFALHFRVAERVPLPDSERVLYRFERHRLA